jgi:hypothetical protein
MMANPPAITAIKKTEPIKRMRDKDNDAPRAIIIMVIPAVIKARVFKKK